MGYYASRHVSIPAAAWMTAVHARGMFPDVSETSQAGATPAPEEMDLRGVKCPLNWARAKVRLEAMPPCARLRLRVDDPQAVRDIPRAAEAHGHVLVETLTDGSSWTIEIER